LGPGIGGFSHSLVSAFQVFFQFFSLFLFRLLRGGRKKKSGNSGERSGRKEPGRGENRPVPIGFSTRRMPKFFTEFSEIATTTDLEGF